MWRRGRDTILFIVSHNWATILRAKPHTVLMPRRATAVRVWAERCAALLHVFGRRPCVCPHARHTIIVYTPWRKYPTNRNWIAEFKEYIHSAACIPSCRLAYDRVMLRHYHKLSYYEATTTPVDRSGDSLPSEIKDILFLAGLDATEVGDAETMDINSLHRGKEYEWDKPPMVRVTLTLQWSIYTSYSHKSNNHTEKETCRRRP